MSEPWPWCCAVLVTWSWEQWCCKLSCVMGSHATFRQHDSYGGVYITYCFYYKYCKFFYGTPEILSFSSTVWNVSASVKMVKWHPWPRNWNNWYLVIIIICYYIVNCVTVAYNWPSLFHCNYGRVGCFCECWLWNYKYLSIFTIFHMSHFRFCLLCHNFAEKNTVTAKYVT